MIVSRTIPAPHTISWSGTNSDKTYSGEGFTFHPGANFVPDSLYYSKFEKNPDYIAQIKSGLIVVDFHPSKQEQGKQIAPAAINMQEQIAIIPEALAITIIAKTIDGDSLKDISKIDKRRNVRDAAEKQIANRQAFMNGLAQKSVNVDPKRPISFGVNG